MELLNKLNWRYAAKAMNGEKVSEEKIDRIIEAARQRINLAPEKVMINIQKYGNTTAGTLPICLAEWEHKLKKGDKLVLTTFGGGFTWGATYMVWGY